MFSFDENTQLNPVMPAIFGSFYHLNRKQLDETISSTLGKTLQDFSRLVNANQITQDQFNLVTRKTVLKGMLYSALFSAGLSLASAVSSKSDLNSKEWMEYASDLCLSVLASWAGSYLGCSIFFQNLDDIFIPWRAGAISFLPAVLGDYVLGFES